MLEITLWVLLGAAVVFMVAKVLLRDAFLVSLVSLVVMAAAGMVVVTAAEGQSQVAVWIAGVVALALGWLLRPLNAVAGPVRGKSADGGIYHHTDEDRAVLRKGRLMVAWKPLLAVAAVVLILWVYQGITASAWLAPLIGAVGVGFAVAALTGMVSRRLTGLLEIRQS